MRGGRGVLWATVIGATLVTSGVAQAADTRPVATTLLPAPAATLAQLTQAVGGRGATQAPARYAYLRKLSGSLQELAANGGGDASVDVYVTGSAARAAEELRALGMRVGAISERAPSRVVEGVLPPPALARAAALPETRAILPTFTRVSATTSEGDGAIFGPQARALGPTGAGVSVGIISDSFDQAPIGGAAVSQGSGDLPASVQNLSDQPGGTDEGRAMAEIVYDEAPGISSIQFASGTLGGAAEKANAINTLVGHGVSVIADDIGILNEPFFQDGIVAQAVDRAHAAGVAYFSAAGNDQRNAWEGTYSGGASEDFDPGAAVDTMQSVGPVPAGRVVTFVLQWAEPWGGASSDFALDVYTVAPGPVTLLGTADDPNITSGIPQEFGSVTIGGVATTLGLVIRRVSGSGNPFMKYIAFTNGAAVAMEHAATSGTISPDAASAAGALTVAASPFGTPTTPEAFSSRGPVRRFFEANGTPLATPVVRQKPELAAPDGVSTSLTGSLPSSNADFAPFFGTSAAAPAAAGIAALIRSAKPAMGVDELYAIMTSPANALDCTLSAVVPDPDCGAGFVLANRAVQMALDPTPPAITPSIAPATPDGANGWYHVPVAVTWNVSDPESPVTRPAGCDATAVPATATLTCSATSAGGTASVPVTVKVDDSPPTAPVIAGIGARTYLPTGLPAASAIRCSAGDPNSGVDSCVVSGFKSATGPHTLTAVAVNDAGLASTTTLTYTVAKLAAIARVAFAKGLTPAKLAKAGVPLTVRVAKGSTRLVVKLVITIPRASGQGTLTLRFATVTRKVSAGNVKLQLKLTPQAQQVLAAARQATVKITISGSSPLAKPKSLQRSLVVRR